MYSTSETIQLLQQHADNLQQRFGLSGLVLYGSYAQDKQHAESDIDLMFELKVGHTMPLMRLQKMQQYLQELLQVSKVETVNRKYVNPVVYSNLQQNAITIF